MAQWTFQSIIENNKEFKIKGLNIWNHYWHCSDRKVEVIEPFEGQIYFFKEYEIRDNNVEIKFVAGEYSNGKMGLYLKED
ncbi:MAG: hypothetical protein JST62_12960 [Bacteroidetes bacterium]|nr:hypothetical protein [Bacteroidota bacterium]